MLLGFSLGLWPMCALLFSILLIFVKSLNSWLYLASWCPLVLLAFLDIVRSNVYTPGLVSKFLSV